MLDGYQIENILVPYLKQNMKLKWVRGNDGYCYIAITIGKEVITKVKFEIDY